MRRPAVITLQQVAQELQISERTVYRRVKDGSIPAFKMGCLWRCPVSYIDNLRGEVPGSSHTLSSGDLNEEKTSLSAGNAFEVQDGRGDMLVHPLRGHDAGKPEAPTTSGRTAGEVPNGSERQPRRPSDPGPIQ